LTIRGPCLRCPLSHVLSQHRKLLPATVMNYSPNSLFLFYRRLEQYFWTFVLKCRHPRVLHRKSKFARDFNPHLEPPDHCAPAGRCRAVRKVARVSAMATRCPTWRRCCVGGCRAAAAAGAGGRAVAAVVGGGPGDSPASWAERGSSGRGRRGAWASHCWPS
jgi:hypothetical protein